MSRIHKGNADLKADGQHGSRYFYSKDAMRQNIPMAQPITPEVERAAGITVCANATDRDEAVTFLKMLGLIK